MVLSQLKIKRSAVKTCLVLLLIIHKSLTAIVIVVKA